MAVGSPAVRWRGGIPPWGSGRGSCRESWGGIPPRGDVGGGRCPCPGRALQLPGGGDPVADVGAGRGAAGPARGPAVPPPGRGVSGGPAPGPGTWGTGGFGRAGGFQTPRHLRPSDAG